jgi:flagellar biosynthesis protein FlhG
VNDQATHLRSLLEGEQRSHAAASHIGESGAVATLPPPPAVHSAMVPPSAPIGAVSYGPACSRPVVKRHVTLARPSRLTIAPPRPVQLARTIGICSGKGGVGKSSLAVNLAVIMSQPREVGGMGLKVCLLDADLGMANADVLCNLKPRATLEHVVSGKCELKDAMMLAPGGFWLIPGASGVTGMADLSLTSRNVVLQQLIVLEQIADVILVDCGAGISSNVAAFAAAATTTVVATTPEPTAMTDGYGMVKTLVMRTRDSLAPGQAHIHSLRRECEGATKPDIRVLVNMATDDREGSAVFARMNRVSATFLDQSLRFAGVIPHDPAVAMAVRQRMPFALFAPESPATRAVRRIATGLVGGELPSQHVDNSVMGSSERPSFFARLAVWLGMAEYVD